MGAVDITARLREWITTAIGDGCLGEEIWFDTSWQTAQAGGGYALSYSVVIAMKSPLLGQGPLAIPFLVPIAAMREDAVRMGVHHAIGKLRELHKQLLDNPRPVVKTTPS
jgi:hypothetical protein